ncbi:MAG: TIGR02300 family protein [Thalassobaculaceae bacterium]
MGKIERGIKRICQECGALYYDLEKNPIVCPKCGAEFDPEAILKSRRTRPLVPENEEKQKAEDEETDNSEDLDEVETTIDDEEDGVVGGILPAVEVEGEDGVSVGSNDEDILDNEAVLDDGDDLDDEQDMLKLDD